MCDLRQVQFGFLTSRPFELADTKTINISFRSCFLKFLLRASFFTRNFGEKTCNTMHRFRPCLVVHCAQVFLSSPLQSVWYGKDLIWHICCHTELRTEQQDNRRYMFQLFKQIKITKRPPIINTHGPMFHQ